VEGEKREKANEQLTLRREFLVFGFIVLEPAHEENERKQLKESANKNSAQQARFCFSFYLQLKTNN
jgi:hypothetical protein